MRDTVFPIVVIGVVLAAFLWTAPALYDSEKVDKHIDVSQAYCEQTYGDETVYQANVVGGHGGLHCDAYHDGPHLHDIPYEYKLQAYNASMNGTDLGWSVETAYEHAEETPWKIPVLAITPGTLGMLLVPAALVLGALIVMSHYQGGSDD